MKIFRRNNGVNNQLFLFVHFQPQEKNITRLTGIALMEKPDLLIFNPVVQAPSYGRFCLPLLFFFVLKEKIERFLQL